MDKLKISCEILSKTDNDDLQFVYSVSFQISRSNLPK